MENKHRSRLMRLSWEIQRRRQATRSKALLSAWAIFLNEDITVFHLVEKHTPDNRRSQRRPEAARLTLFNY